MFNTNSDVLHLSEITRFSNFRCRPYDVISFYTYLKLQGSQTNVSFLLQFK